MSDARYIHTASLLENGKVLVTGGYIAGIYLNSVELYNPSTRKWSTISSMSSKRWVHAASVLTNDKVLVTGGVNNITTLNSAELYQSF
jgi:N-acetylneuraminic acid mutarotase